jgi:molybdate transport system substrate-binding protein
MAEILKHILLFFIGGIITSSCGSGMTETGADGGKPEKIIVATAANVQFAMRELEQSFEDSAGINVEVVISSSGKLTAQIRQGAPYDLLLSANMKYPQTLYQDGWATTPPEVYALGSLVLWTLKDLELQEDLSFLKDPEIDKIAIANPRNAPYGEQAFRAFDFFDIHESLKSKLIYGENIASTNQYILSRACDVGLTAKSVVLSPEMEGRGQWVEVPGGAYDSIKQGVIITKHGQSEHGAASRRFYDFLFSATAAAIFERYGYSIPKKDI